VSPQQIRILAVAEMVQGGLEGAWGVVFALSPGGTDGTVGAVPTWVALSLGGLALAAIGLLRVVAGALNMFYRGRRLGIATLAAGLLSGLLCLCFPTAVALFVYGLAVHRNPAVRHAFEMRSRGASVADVDRMLFLGQAPPSAHLDLAMQVVNQFGAERARPPGERLREKAPFLGPAQIEELIATCRKIESFAYELGGELSSDLLDLDSGVRRLRERYPALSLETAKEVVWQGRYFWWRDHG
jgi:hypothetical protein